MSMEVLPIIYLHKREIYDKMEGEAVPLNALFDVLPPDEKVYVYDRDGLEKDKPNLYLYQKLSQRHTLWVDGGPRTLGDVVDILMAGAAALTVRQEIWRNVDVSAIKELTENEVYLCADIRASQQTVKQVTGTLGQETGTVLFNAATLADLRTISYLQKAGKKGYKLYVCGPNDERAKYWEDKQITGLIIELPYWKRVKKNGF